MEKNSRGSEQYPDFWMKKKVEPGEHWWFDVKDKPHEDDKQVDAVKQCDRQECVS